MQKGGDQLEGLNFMAGSPTQLSLMPEEAYQASYSKASIQRVPSITGNFSNDVSRPNFATIDRLREQDS